MDKRVWAILRPHYSPEGILEELGICGSGFFIKPNIFVSAHHVLNETSFLPNHRYFNNNLFLVNSEGKKIEISSKNLSGMIPSLDLTILKIDGREEYFEIEENYSKGDEIINIGYPQRFFGEIFNGKRFQIKKQFENSGKIIQIHKNYFMNANDVKISNKKVIILNYSSEGGFSGGPLLKNGKVIGLISHLYPKNKNVIAISVEEIKKYL